MATALTLRGVLHRPQFEVCNPLPVASVLGGFACSLSIPALNILSAYLCVDTANGIYEYDLVSDAAVLLGASGIAGTFGAGACGYLNPSGPSGTATAGTTTTLTTNLTLNRDIRGYRIRITGGPGAGDLRIIASNTLGANSVITVTGAFSATITAASTYLLLTPRLWVFAPAATPGLGYYDWALGAWVAGRSTAGVTFTGTDGVLLSTAGAIGNLLDSSDSAGLAPIVSSTTTIVTLADPVATVSSGRNWDVNQWAGAVVQIVAGTGVGQTRIISSNTAKTFTVSAVWSTTPDATSVWQITKAQASSGSNGAVFAACSTTVLTLTGVNWAVNQWTNAQLRAVSGAGAGQVRTIASNTAFTLTVSAAMTAFSATTIWVIEGNDDSLYLAGNGALTVYQYSISGNAWSALAPVTPRAAAPGPGMSLCWVSPVNDAGWANENAVKNGRYLYSFRGNNSNILDYYDIAANTWINGLVYANQNEAFTTGVSWAYLNNNTLVCAQAATGRFFYYDFVKNALLPYGQHTFSQGAAILGDKLFSVFYADGSVKLPVVYQWLHASAGLVRILGWHTPGLKLA